MQSKNVLKIISVFLTVLLIVSCAKERYKIDWVVLSDVPEEVFRRIPIELSFYSGTTRLKRHTVNLIPNRTKYLVIHKDWRLIETGGPGGVSMLFYPDVDHISKTGYDRMEIYLFSMVPEYKDEKTVVFNKNDYVIGYSYDYIEDGKVYTIVSKSNSISLEDRRIKLADDVSFEEIVEAIQEHDIYYNNISTWVLAGNDLLAPQEFSNQVMYIVKSKIDGNIFWLP
jgi:hypothetical protein